MEESVKLKAIFLIMFTCS